MLLLALVAISLIKSSQCVKAIPGQPVPHADVLSALLSKYLGDSYSNNALFDFILGQPSQNRDNITEDNLDISILDVNNVRKIIAFAKKKHEDKVMEAEKTRRHTHGEEFFEWDEYLVNKSLDLIQHSMYMTKEKLNLTRPFRKRYSSEVGYKIAILYGSSAAILVKMETLYHKLLRFYQKTSFIFHLIIYEKILACNIDINDAVEKIFIVHNEFIQNRGSLDKWKVIQERGNLTDDEFKAMMFDPLASQNYKDLLQQHKNRLARK